MKKIYIIILILSLILIGLMGASIWLIVSLSGGNIGILGGDEIAKVYLCNPIYFDYNQDTGLFSPEKKE